MKVFISLITTIIVFLCVWGIGVLTMMNGWGLEPKSWAWIIGAGIASVILTIVMSVVSAVLGALTD
jgi:hypothetical protein